VAQQWLLVYTIMKNEDVCATLSECSLVTLRCDVSHCVVNLTMFIKLTKPCERFLPPHTYLSLDGDIAIASEQTSNPDNRARLHQEASCRYYHNHLHMCRQKSREKVEQ
jgi:hypothetical protein